MRPRNLKIGSKRLLLTAAVAVGIAVPFASVGQGGGASGGAWLIADESCLPDTTPAVTAPDRAGVHRGVFRHLYPGGPERPNWNDQSPAPIAVVLPGSPDETATVDERKATFVAAVLPMIHRVNQEIMRDRRLVETAAGCREEGRPIGPPLRTEILGLHERYRTEGDFATLRRRLDIVPPSLAIAQAAIESGWGTSRFALHGNALFGQRTTNSDRGMRPAELPATTPVRVAAFDHVMESVRAYVHNLNTHPAYRGFRARRAALRRNGDKLDGLTLAETLTAYSIRRGAYVRELKSIIRNNRFAALDTLTGATRTGGRPSGSDT